MRPNRRACIAGHDRPAEQDRALDEVVQLGEVVLPRTRAPGLGLGAGGVEHEHVDRAEAVADHCGQVGDLVLVGDVGAEALGRAAARPDRLGRRRRPAVTAAVVHRHRQAILRQPLGDRGPNPRELPVTRATRPCATSMRR